MKVGDICTACGYYGENIGRVCVECCALCERDFPTGHDIGRCRVCEGTGRVVRPEETNRLMIKASIPPDGYLCARDPAQETEEEMKYKTAQVEKAIEYIYRMKAFLKSQMGKDDADVGFLTALECIIDILEDEPSEKE